MLRIEVRPAAVDPDAFFQQPQGAEQWLFHHVGVAGAVDVVVRSMAWTRSVIRSLGRHQPDCDHDQDHGCNGED